jgi:hypothetical protein
MNGDNNEDLGHTRQEPIEQKEGVTGHGNATIVSDPVIGVTDDPDPEEDPDDGIAPVDPDDDDDDDEVKSKVVSKEYSGVVTDRVEPVKTVIEDADGTRHTVAGDVNEDDL